MTKERLAVLEDKHKQTFLTFDECQELLSAARESIRLQAENAKLKKHAEAMEAEIFNLSAYDSNDAVIAYHLDFPKEPDK